MLAGRGRRTRHLGDRPVETDRGRDLLDPAEHRVVDLDHHPVVPRLRLVEHLGRDAGARPRTRRRPSGVPPSRRAGCDAKRGWSSRSSSSACSGVSGVPMSMPVSLGGIRSSSPSTSISRPNAPTAPVWMPMYSSSLHTNERVISRIPLPRVIDRSMPGLRRHAGVRLTPHHREERERAVEEGSLHVPTDTVVETAIERGEHPDERELRGAGARERQPLEDGPFAVAGLLGHRADDGVDERLVADDVAVRAVGPEARDRAVHETGVEPVQRVEVETETLGDAGPPALDEHVGAPGERDERARAASGPSGRARCCACPGCTPTPRPAAGVGTDRRPEAPPTRRRRRSRRAARWPAGRRSPGAIDDPQSFEDP